MRDNEVISNSFFNNLFGTIAGGSALSRLPSDIGFIPLDGSGNTLRIKGEQASWLGLNLPLQQLYAYNYCYPVASVIDRLAESDITGVVEILRASGKGKENFATNEWSNLMRKRLAQPNPMQTWEQFRGQQVMFKKVFGFCPVFPIVPAGFGPEYCSSMINLPPWLFEAEATNNLLFETKIEDIVKRYKVSILGKTFYLNPSEVFILDDSFMPNYDTNFILPQSRLRGLDMAVSNVCAAMEADNVLLRKKGPLGFLSHEQDKDAAGNIPMRQEDKDDLQADLRRYGMSWDQYQYVVSKVAMKWNPMSFNVKELGTKETVLAGARAICQRFGFPFVLFEDSDATYSNQESAHKKLFDSNVVPNSKRDTSKYNSFFKAEENNCRITVDFTHLAIYQEDILNVGRGRQYMDQGLQIEYLNDIITKNQWLEAIDMDTIGPEGDVFYSQSPAKLAKDEQAAALAQAQALSAQEQNQPPAK